MAMDKDNKYNPMMSSDAETDKMEGMDERESQLEVLSGGSDINDKKRDLDSYIQDLESNGDEVKKKLKAESNDIDKIERHPIKTESDLNNNVTLQAVDDEDNEGENEDEEDEEDEEEENNADIHKKKEKDGKKEINEVKEEKEEEEEKQEEEENEEQGYEAHAKTQLEEQQKEVTRVAAMNGLKDIEILFAKLKDRLYDTQLTKLDFELKLCENNQHPELLEYMKMIDEDFKKKAERLINLQKYKLKTLDSQTRATRVSLHQQFIKMKQDLKSEEILNITTNWYDINKERRIMDIQTLELPEYYQFNESINNSNIESYLPSLINNRNSVFKELSQLQGLIKFKRMIPSSFNNLNGCSEDEILNDLKEMGIKKNIKNE